MRLSKCILQLNAEIGTGVYAQLCIGLSHAREQPLAQLLSLGGFCVHVPRLAYHPIIPFHDSLFTMDNLQVWNKFNVSFPRSPVSTFRVTKHPHPDVLLFIIHFPLRGPADARTAF
jgi:hypothetical protein